MITYCSICGEVAIDSGLRCLAHLKAHDEAAYAELYAVASILYYEHDLSLLTDPSFDGICHWLLDANAPARIPWLEREQLSAGSGYVSAGFPAEYRRIAQEIAQRSKGG